MGGGEPIKGDQLAGFGTPTGCARSGDLPLGPQGAHILRFPIMRVKRIRLQNRCFCSFSAQNSI
jgi:hypothetical protein